MGPVVPFDYERRQPLFRRPHVVGHDGDGIVEPHDLTHALDDLGRCIVHALYSAAKHRRLRQGRDLHARRANVDAIDGRSIDLGRRVEPLGRCADQRKILRLLQRHRLRNRHARRIGGKIAVFGASPRRRVKHFALLRVAGRSIDIPALCRRRDQHGSRGRTGLAQWLPDCAYCVRAAGSPARRPARDFRRAFRLAAHVPAAPASGRPPALRRSASGSRYRSPGPSRHRASSGRPARHLQCG